VKIIYATDKLEKQCTDLKEAKKAFGGDKGLAISLLARVNAIRAAHVIKDIIAMPQFHFHKLSGKKEGLFAVDVKSRRDKWRIILCPLDENEEIFGSCHIDEICTIVSIVEIVEVSAHYE